MKSTQTGWKQRFKPIGTTGLSVAVIVALGCLVCGAASRAHAQSEPALESPPDDASSASPSGDGSYDGVGPATDTTRTTSVATTTAPNMVVTVAATPTDATAPDPDALTNNTPPPPAPAPDETDEDGDRHRHFWIDAAIGYSWIALGRLDQSNFAPDTTTTTSSGLVAEVGLGVEVSVLRFGIAGSYAQYNGFDVGTAELDVQLVIPIPIVQPYIEAGFGYGWIGNVEATNTNTSTTATVPIHGIAIDLGIGLDIAVSDVVQFGIGVDASFLNLQRQRVTELDTIGNVDFTKAGNSLGLQVHGVGRITFQF